MISHFPNEVIYGSIFYVVHQCTGEADCKLRNIYIVVLITKVDHHTSRASSLPRWSLLGETSYYVIFVLLLDSNGRKFLHLLINEFSNYIKILIILMSSL